MPTPSKHTLLSPSSAHRWLNCTPSAKLESVEPGITSPYAKEGTEAHSLAEIKLSYMLGRITPQEYETRFQAFRLESEYYNSDFNEYVNDYCKSVMDILHMDYSDKARIELEEYVTFDDIIPNGGGTSDCVIIGHNFIHIIDLKFGKGVPVSAIGNPQLRLYALGAVKRHLRECTCTEVRMTIIQPRLDNISTEILPISELNDWAMNYVKPRAQLAITGKGELVSGEHCKFCKIKGKCKALADKQLADAKAEFQEAVVENHMVEVNQISPEIMSRILSIAPMFNEWFKSVESYALDAAVNQGVKIPGYKVVEGRSNRVIVNPEGVIDKLKEAGFAEEDYLKPQELQGITNLEKNIGKKLFSNLCSQFIIKPTGKLTLVPESDGRPAVDVSSITFNGTEFENNDAEEQ